MHEDQHGQIRLNGDPSDPFPIVNGVKQGCVLAQTFFSILFSMMLKQATVDLDDEDGVYARYHLEGSLYNLQACRPILRPRKGWCGSSSSHTTLPSLPTQKELHRQSQPVLQALFSSLASRSASRRQRSFTSPRSRRNTTRPPKPSAKQS